MTQPPRSTGDLIAVLHQDADNVVDPETFLRALTAQATATRRPRSTQRWLLPAVAAAAVAAVALVAVWVAAGRAKQPLSPAEPKPTATPQGATLNRQLTTAETIRLVRLVNLPAGSAVTSMRPSALSGPALGTRLSSSLSVATPVRGMVNSAGRRRCPP